MSLNDILVGLAEMNGSIYFNKTPGGITTLTMSVSAEDARFQHSVSRAVPTDTVNLDLIDQIYFAYLQIRRNLNLDGSSRGRECR